MKRLFRLLLVPALLAVSAFSLTGCDPIICVNPPGEGGLCIPG